MLIFTVFICLISPLLAVDKLSYQQFFENHVSGKISLISSLAKRNKGATTALAILVASVAIFYPLVFNVPQIFHKVLGSMNSNYRFLSSSGFGNRFGGSSSSSTSREARFAMKNGGELGGISNDGNTCFMNSVIQSLASSKQLNQFIERNIHTENQLVASANMPVSRLNRTNLVFTRALKKLLDDVNGAYGSRGKEFSTRGLLNKMPNGPKQNFFTGYSQEDAQEFYQLVMRIVEKEYKNISQSREPTPEPETDNELKSDLARFIDAKSFSNLPFGCDKLGKLGKVFVPAHQVDPNIPDTEGKVLPLELVTPVDGVSAERIGCVSCGEVGGIRYSVLSGLSLNLPYDASNYNSFTLHQLLNEWSKPEMIDEVNCNRCGLLQTREFLSQSMQKSSNERLGADFKKRIGEIENELAKDHIADEVFERLTTKSMIRKTTKTKQALLSRPPPLLCVHINRSVFDPRTYMIVKNSKTVRFPVKLDLNPYIAEPKDINMDARLPFRKQDSVANGAANDVESEENSESQEPTLGKALLGNPDLLYNLKAVISHYGTHNYGHYICYRRLRGTWWRISDESVYVVNEAEVLSSQGTFMLFYEWDDHVVENLAQLDEEELEKETVSAEVEKENTEESKNAGDLLLSLSDEENENDVMDELEIEDSNSHESAVSDSPVDNTSKVSEDAPIFQDQYRLGEERAFHV